MQKRITWRNLEFDIDNTQVCLSKTYPLKNAKVKIRLRLSEHEKKCPISAISTNDQNQLVIDYQDKTQRTKSLAELIQLFPTKLSSEQLQLFDCKGDVKIEYDIPQHHHDLTWGNMRVHVDKQNHNVLGELEQQNVTIVENRSRGTVKHLLVIPSQSNHKENNLLIFYDHGCIEQRNLFQYEYYHKKLQMRVTAAHKQTFAQAQKMWAQKMTTVPQANNQTLTGLLNKVFALTQALEKMYKDPSLLTTLLNNIMQVLDAKYAVIKNDFSTHDVDTSTQQFILHAKAFLKKRYAQGIVWGTVALSFGLALTALMAVFFSGVLFSGIGSIIVGCITATAAAVTLITDGSYLKDTTQIGRMRANLNKLIKVWDAKTIAQTNDPLAQPLLAKKHR